MESRGGIHTMWLDGSHLRRVTSEGRGTDWTPALAPDDRRIAYIRNVRVHPRAHSYLQVVDRRTGRIRRLSADDMASPAWAPGGRRIVAEAVVGDNKSRLVVIDSRTRRIRPLGSTGWLQVEPAWSPDGSAIIFTGQTRYRSEAYSDLRTITPRGHHQRVLFAGSHNAASPSWAPNGRHVVFTERGVERPQEGEPWSHIVTIRSDGTHRRVVLGGRQMHAYGPAYTSDGRWIVFQREADGTAWAIRPNGRRLHQLSPVSAWFPQPGF